MVRPRRSSAASDEEDVPERQQVCLLSECGPEGLKKCADGILW